MRLAIPFFLCLAALPAFASAHAILVDSTPPARGSLPAGRAALRFRFNSRIDRDRSSLTLIAADRSQTRLAVRADGPPDVMAAEADLRPGDYTVRWQVLAVDGHITRGDVPITVTPP